MEIMLLKNSQNLHIWATRLVKLEFDIADLGLSLFGLKFTIENSSVGYLNSSLTRQTQVSQLIFPHLSF